MSLDHDCQQIDHHQDHPWHQVMATSTRCCSSTRLTPRSTRGARRWRRGWQGGRKWSRRMAFEMLSLNYEVIWWHWQGARKWSRRMAFEMFEFELLKLYDGWPGGWRSPRRMIFEMWRFNIFFADKRLLWEGPVLASTVWDRWTTSLSASASWSAKPLLASKPM